MERVTTCAVLTTALWTTMLLSSTAAQTTPPSPGTRGLLPREAQDVSRESGNIRSIYLLGPGDVLQIRIPESDEMSDKPFRIESDGDVNLPFLGRTRAAGMTIEAFEQVLLREIQPYVKASRISASVVQFRTEVVYLLGAFRSPGSYQLQDHRRLVDVIALAGGLAPTANRRLRITRRLTYGAIPLASATTDPARNISTVEIVLDSEMSVEDPSANIILAPFDTITAARAEVVYISGEVAKPGAYELNDKDSISLTQALALAGGFSREAQPQKARILRPIMDTDRRAAIPIDLNKALSGTANDFPLMANDVLYVPRSAQKKNAVGQFLMYTIPTVVAALALAAVQ